MRNENEIFLDKSDVIKILSRIFISDELIYMLIILFCNLEAVKLTVVKYYLMFY